MSKDVKYSNELKSVIIGPYPPYRGGIAQYNSQLHKALSKMSNTRVISFKRLYPKLLYPGKSDKVENLLPKDHKDVKYIIDAYSPLSLKRALAEIRNVHPDVVIITWWTLFWQPGMAYIAYKLKKTDIKTIFLCHNLFDHDAKKLKQKISELLLKQANGYIVHANEHVKQIKTFNSNAKVMQRMHPIYNQYPAPKKRLAKRGKLEILFFGFIRPYKGLTTLIDALAILRDKDIYPVIVGETWTSKKELEKSLYDKSIPNLELNLQYVSEQESATYFDRADIVVLPYKSATGSGVVATAYHYNKPVLAASVGGLRDSVIIGKTGWLVKPNSSKSLASAIESIKRNEIKKMIKHISEFKKENNWDNFAKHIVEFCSSNF
jgi:glycosyltransferase involved in cell wall biosynthesis